MSLFLTYSKFHTKGEAEEFTAMLNDHGIPYEMEYAVVPVGSIYVGEDPNPKYLVKLATSDFDKVNRLMEKRMQQQLDDVNPDYYLFHFTNEELKEVVEKPDEWNYFDQLLARKLLQEQNIVIEELPAPVHIPDACKDYTPVRIGLQWLLLGYCCIPVLPLWTIAMGFGLQVAKRTLKDGSKVPIYDQPSREHGKVMIVLGLLAIIFVVFLYSR